MTAQQDDDLPTIDFVSPMPGFAEHRRFVLVRLDDDGLLYALASVHDPELRFLVVPPPPFFPDYAPEITEDDLASLGTSDVTQILLLLVITTAESAADSTANLMAPILVDQSTRRALQVVLSGSGLPVRAELMAHA
ncbi:MAG TPA: flagellar assembly protein FliW [Pilimelia sp.]|nr:flagellar assembly protein FliW [Pilimelia sp.]